MTFENYIVIDRFGREWKFVQDSFSDIQDSESIKLECINQVGVENRPFIEVLEWWGFYDNAGHDKPYLKARFAD